MRHIREIENLPVNQLTDEEILKATMKRLKTKSIMLVYDDEENNKWVFLGRYKKGGLLMMKRLREAWEEKFGKFKKMEEEE
jgi:hypothetical protein